MSRVTVSIPFHNDSPEIFHAVTSALNQSYDDLTVLLISDGAPDYVVDRLSSIKDPRLTILHDGSSQGLASRLNQSLDILDSEFYFRMDADDIMHPMRVAEQVDAFDQNASISVLGSSAALIDKSNNIVGKRTVRAGAVESLSVFDGNPFIHPTVAFRATWLADRRYGSNYSRTEDRRFWIEHFEAGAYANLSSILLFYRVRFSQPLDIVTRTAREERALLRQFAAPGYRRSAFVARSYAKEAVQIPLEISGASRFLKSRRGSNIKGLEAIQLGQALLDVSEATAKRFDIGHSGNDRG